MKTKKLWVYLAILLVVAGVFLLTEYVFIKKNPEKESAALFTVVPGEIQTISWQRGSEVVELKKDKQWEILRPIRAAADPVVVEGVLTKLANLRPERRFPPTGKDLAEFGLKPPQVVIDFTAQGKSHEIRIGAKAAVGNAQYLMVSGSEDIFLAEAFTIRELDRDVTALRDKRLFTLTLDQAESLALRSGANNWHLRKTDKGWIEEGEPERPLSKSRVESFIIELTWAKVRNFLAGEKETPAWGLQKPQTRIVLKGGGVHPVEETLEIGAEAPEKGFYARSSRYPGAIIVDGALIGRIPKDLSEWRENPQSKTGEQPREEKKGP